MTCSTLQAVVDLHRAAAPDRRRVEQLLAELEFDLASRLPDGPVVVHLTPDGAHDRPSESGDPVEPWSSLCAEGATRIEFHRGLEHRELRSVLDVLGHDDHTVDRRTRLGVADLEHVRFDFGGAAEPSDRAAVRKLLAPDAPLAMTAALPERDLRTLHAQHKLGWLRDAAPFQPEVDPEVVAEGNDPVPAAPRAASTGWRRFVRLTLAGVSRRPHGDRPVAPGVALGCFDSLVAAGEVGSAAAILAAVRNAKWPEAAVLKTALDSPERVARRIALDDDLAGDAPVSAFQALLDHPDVVVRRRALSRVLTQPTPETGPAILRALGAADLPHIDPGERAALLAAVVHLELIDAVEPLEELVNRKGAKGDPAVVASQVDAAGALGRLGEPGRRALKRSGRGWSTHRDVRHAVRDALESEGSP